jgi:16S rRNA (guanine527-N7)-methyltransferase
MATRVLKYFPALTSSQREQIVAMEGIYSHWNKAINIISRKDFENFYTNHVLHSLSIAKLFQFLPKEKILDFGTGGGFPGIPLAILFPETSFVLIDSTGKKIKVVNEVVNHLNLKNVTPVTGRAEEHNEKYNYIVTRAVATLKIITGWTANNMVKGEGNKGIIALKGGDVAEEIAGFEKQTTVWNVSEFFPEEFFITKKVIWLQL